MESVVDWRWNLLDLELDLFRCKLWLTNLHVEVASYESRPLPKPIVHGVRSLDFEVEKLHRCNHRLGLESSCSLRTPNYSQHLLSDPRKVPIFVSCFHKYIDYIHWRNENKNRQSIFIINLIRGINFYFKLSMFYQI